MAQPTWPEEFRTRRELQHKNNNPAEADLFLSEIDEEDIIGSFTRASNDPYAISWKGKMLTRFLGRVSVDELLKDSLHAPDPDSKNNILLIETDSQNLRRQHPPMTARMLYDRLKGPRLHRAGGEQEHAISESRSASAQDGFEASTPGQDRVSAEIDRRIICIKNPDRWSIAALVATVSVHQARVLRNTLYRYLGAETHIGIICQQPELTFELAFHLPSIGWRSSRDPMLDRRVDPNGHTLRKIQDVSFLDWECSSPSFLYHATYSFAMLGADEWRWMAYCLVDTILDSGPDDDMPLDSELSDCHMSWSTSETDPSGQGSHTLGDECQDPRGYFLCILRARLGVVVAEWQYIIERISHAMLDRDELWPSGSDLNAHNITQSKRLGWATRVEALINQLLLHLRQLVAVGSSFQRKHLKLFEGAPNAAQGHLAAIQHELETLSVIEQRLQCLHDQAHNMSYEFQRQQKLHISLEIANSERDMKNMTRDSRAIAFILMICSPFVLTCAVFSMDDSARKFIFPPLLASPSINVFLYVLAVFSFVMLVSAMCLNIIPLAFARSLWPDIEVQNFWHFVTTSAQSMKATTLPVATTCWEPIWLSENTENTLKDTTVTEPERDEITAQLPPGDAAMFSAGETDTESSDSKLSTFELLGSISNSDLAGIAETSTGPDSSARLVLDEQASDAGTHAHPTTHAPRLDSGPSILPSYSQRAAPSPAHCGNFLNFRNRYRPNYAPEVAISLQERDVRLRGDGHFIYVCMGGQVFCRLIELDAKELASDESFIRELNKRRRLQWSQLWLLITMSASDQVHLKQFHFVSNGAVVCCSRSSSLPPSTHEQYRHHGPDITCREDMIAHDLRKDSERQWREQSSDVVPDRIYPGQERIILDAIPKRVPYRLEYLKGREGWGLHISLRLCHYRMALCMVFWVGASAISIALMLDRQTSSLQDAFVPAGISLTLFIFYFGLMTGLRQ